MNRMWAPLSRKKFRADSQESPVRFDYGEPFEPKRLVSAGLATSPEEWTGKRRRPIYAIADAGRAALADWLASPSSRRCYESEGLLKVLFAETGRRRTC